MSGENAFELAPSCGRCGGRGVVAAPPGRPRPELGVPLTDQQLRQLQLWARGQETCPACGGSGQAPRALSA